MSANQKKKIIKKIPGFHLVGNPWDLYYPLEIFLFLKNYILTGINKVIWCTRSSKKFHNRPTPPLLFFTTQIKPSLSVQTSLLNWLLVLPECLRINLRAYIFFNWGSMPPETLNCYVLCTSSTSTQNLGVRLLLNWNFCMKSCTHTHSYIPQPLRWHLWNLVTSYHHAPPLKNPDSSGCSPLDNFLNEALIWFMFMVLTIHTLHRVPEFAHTAQGAWWLCILHRVHADYEHTALKHAECAHTAQGAWWLYTLHRVHAYYEYTTQGTCWLHILHRHMLAMHSLHKLHADWAHIAQDAYVLWMHTSLFFPPFIIHHHDYNNSFWVDSLQLQDPSMGAALKSGSWNIFFADYYIVKVGGPR